MADHGKNSGKRTRKYRNDYLKDVRLGEDGEYSYTGNYYVLDEGNGTEAPKILILSVIMMVCATAGGFFPAAGAMNTWYVIIPYAAAVIFSYFNLYYVIKWLYNGRTALREYIYEKTIPRISQCCGATVISGITAFMGDLFYISRHGMEEQVVGTMVLLMALLAAVVMGLVIMRLMTLKKWYLAVPLSTYCEQRKGSDS